MSRPAFSVRAARVLTPYLAATWLTDRCTVETPQGAGLTATWGTPVPNVPCRVIDQAGQLKLGVTGLEAIQGAKVLFRPADVPALGARLTLRNGRELQVDAVNLSTDEPLPSVMATEVKRR